MKLIDMKRRDFHKLALTSMSTLLGLVSTKTEASTLNPSRQASTPQDPILRINSMQSTAEFTGDEPDPNQTRFWDVGGNSKGEVIGNNVYSVGAAYISIPENNSASHKMLTDIGVLKYGRLETVAEKEVFLNNKVLPHFWTGLQLAIRTPIIKCRFPNG